MAAHEGPQLTGTASPALVLHTPQTISVTATLTGSRTTLTHIVLYLIGPPRWTVSPPGPREAASLKPGGSETVTWRVQVPAGGTGGGLTAQAIYDAGPHSTDSVRAAITAGVAYPSVASAFDDCTPTGRRSRSRCPRRTGTPGRRPARTWPSTWPYRNAPGNAQDQHPVQVYYVGVPLAAGKTVQAVVLPNVSASPPSAGSPALHVFAMAIG